MFFLNLISTLKTVKKVKTMKLSYRGISYEYTPLTFETTEGKVGGKYRGIEWRLRKPKNFNALQLSPRLKYRRVDCGIHLILRPSTK
jgi:hypothetical protein